MTIEEILELPFTIRKDGRAWIKVPGHPTAEKNGWVRRYRIVMYELGYNLTPEIVIHHKDENKLNDHPNNLEICTKASHASRHYNLNVINSPEAKNKRVASQVGRHVSEETKRKISKKLVGYKASEEARRKISEAGLRRKKSEEHKRKIAESLTGHKVSKVTRRRISEAHKRRKEVCS
jgi:hypothetical protein